MVMSAEYISKIPKSATLSSGAALRLLIPVTLCNRLRPNMLSAMSSKITTSVAA
jgi:hypothetical protein